ncbi:hypothetical protein KY290_009546 [Solanum tuberosum]|uniref:Uncharacterized protein n=1 Tax=Solanum tuberosum TaxID=4113 RepID=A0ABQ7VX98_SOLTU|nr:hypothetical protein KY290_009546 [Solanum tuberosum]
MVHMARNMRVPPNSASLAEAKKRTLEFFRMCCRSIPEIMEIYNLYDVVSPSQLRYAVAAEVRKNSNVTNPKFMNLAGSGYMNHFDLGCSFIRVMDRVKQYHVQIRGKKIHFLVIASVKIVTLPA